MEPQTPTQTTTTTAPSAPSVQMTQNTTPAPTTPPTPVIESEPVKKPNTLLVVLLTFFVTALLFIGGYFAYKAFYPTPTNTYLASPLASPYASASSMPYASPSGSPSANSGTVEGKICYPSEGIPAGKVVAKNISTSELTSFDYAANTSTLSISLPEGSYYLKYEPNGEGMVGYYTSCTGSEPSCQDNQTKRTSIPVKVEAGKTTSGVSLCDYYYQPGMEPTY